MRSYTLSILGLFTAATAALPGCLSSTGNAPTPGTHVAVDAGGTDPGTDTADQDAIAYRDLASHPGCTTQGLSYAPAQIPGYPCAAKEYLPSGSEDTSKPIVLLVHGNSSSPGDWEICHKGSDPVTSGCADSTTPMLSERLVAAGFHVFAVDMRPDKSDDPTTNDPKTGNAAKNMDHAWGVPIVQSFIGSVMAANPSRDVSIVAFSFGPMVVRDALRRLHRAGKQPFAHIRDLVFASGGHHGVSTFRKLCVDPTSPANVTMAGHCACEMGDRQAYTPTSFEAPLNGPGGAFETPCLDGSTAFGQSGVCGGRSVRYSTVVMRDISQGTYQDEFVSEAAAALQGADNHTLQLSDQDQTGFFYNGLFKNHFGSIRSEAGLTTIMTALSR